MTDSGSENCNKVVKETLEVLNIRHIRTNYYSPPNQIAAWNASIVLAKKLIDGQDTWDLHLNQVLAAIRFNVNEGTDYSPYYLLYNRHVVLPIDNLLKPRDLNIKVRFSIRSHYKSNIWLLCWYMVG